MTHEPECTRYGFDQRDGDCICDIIRAAYQRGRTYERQMTGLDHLADYSVSVEQMEAAYWRGREDASEAVEALRDPSIAIPTIAMAVAAARGEQP